ncbi:Hypothetical protein A7982_03030 [Minicystis rosea]|nr:Hypothetical protein A7982_03030 [Minicystis rosea]
MLDLFLALLLARTLFAAGRARSAQAITAALGATLLWIALALAGWYGRMADTLGPQGAWLLAFLGPSALPGATSRVPASALLAAYPSLARAVLAGILGAGFAATWRWAEAVSPLSDESVRRKEIALTFLLPALLVGVTVLMALMASVLSDPY